MRAVPPSRPPAPSGRGRHRDPVVAVATAPGRGAVGIVRASGRDLSALIQSVCGRALVPRQATLLDFVGSDGQAMDRGLAIHFPAPHSYTGEDVLELQAHGGPVLLQLLLARCLEALPGLRLADPGEFTERAFLNDKLDLAQAEAVADLIDASTEAAARSAARSLSGAFSSEVKRLAERLVQLRLLVEATLDFPEEEIDFLADPTLRERAAHLRQALEQLQADSRQGQLLHDGMTVVLAGRPNAGKSSLLNLLAQRDSAIVSPIPGTTRDVLRERIQIDGLPLHVLDTAGLRASADAIETEGVRRARDAMLRADRVLLLIDDATDDTPAVTALLAELPADVQVTLVRNKIDVSGRAAGVTERGPHAVAEVALSAHTGAGLDALHAHLKACMGYQAAGEGAFSARRRHLAALAHTRVELSNAHTELAAGRGELAAEALRQAQQALGEITGEFTSDDLLGRIFASFCIGK